MGSNLRSRKVSFYGSLLLVGLVGLLLVGAINMEEKTKAHPYQRSREREEGSMRHMSMQKGDDEKPASVHTDLNFMSKRKVPNGPDPIHNRRAGNSRRSPGRVYRGELDKP